MEFKVKVRRLFNDETSLKAICSVTLDDQFAVHGVKVINAKNSTFTVMITGTLSERIGACKYRAEIERLAKAVMADGEEC